MTMPVNYRVIAIESEAQLMLIDSDKQNNDLSYLNHILLCNFENSLINTQVHGLVFAYPLPCLSLASFTSFIGAP